MGIVTKPQAKLGVAVAAICCLVVVGCARERPPLLSETISPRPTWIAREPVPSAQEEAVRVVGYASGHAGLDKRTALLPLDARFTPTRPAGVKADELVSRREACLSGEPPRLLPTAFDEPPDQLPPPRKVEGEKTISLHLDDLEVRKALEILSREGPFNILVSPGVSGRVTASLQNVTPNQALDAVLQLANLIARREGNLIYVYVPEELRAGLGPDQWICTRIYHLNYIRSTDLDWSSS